MSPPELIYFDGPGRANLTRLAFVAGGIEYTDTRFNFEDWPAIKADPASTARQLFGSLPCIKHDDFLLAQSVAMAMYAADLGVSKDLDAKGRAVDLMVAETNEELRGVMYACLFGDDAAKAKGKEALPAKAASKLEALERAIGRKTGEGPFFLGGDKPTLADLAVFDNMESPFPGLKALGVDLTPYPKLVACAEAVGQIEGISAFAKNGFK